MRERWGQFVNDGKNSFYALCVAILSLIIAMSHEVLAPRPYSSIIAVVFSAIIVLAVIVSFIVGKKTHYADSKNAVLGKIGFVVSLCVVAFGMFLCVIAMLVGFALLDEYV